MCAVLLTWIQKNQYIMGELCRFYALESGFAAPPVRRACICGWISRIHLQQKHICVIWDWNWLWLIMLFWGNTLGCLFSFFLFKSKSCSKTAFSVTTVSLWWPCGKTLLALSSVTRQPSTSFLCETSFHCAKHHFIVQFMFLINEEGGLILQHFTVQEIWLFFHTWIICARAESSPITCCSETSK